MKSTTKQTPCFVFKSSSGRLTLVFEGDKGIVRSKSEALVHGEYEWGDERDCPAGLAFQVIKEMLYDKPESCAIMEDLPAIPQDAWKALD